MVNALDARVKWGDITLEETEFKRNAPSDLWSLLRTKDAQFLEYQLIITLDFMFIFYFDNVKNNYYRYLRKVDNFFY